MIARIFFFSSFGWDGVLFFCIIISCADYAMYDFVNDSTSYASHVQFIASINEFASFWQIIEQDNFEGSEIKEKEYECECLHIF